MSIDIDGWYMSCSGSVNFSTLPMLLESLVVVHTSLSGEVDLAHLPSGLSLLAISSNSFSGEVDLTHLPISVTSFDITYNSFSSIIFGEAIMQSTNNEHGLSIHHNPWRCPMPALPSWIEYPRCTGVTIFSLNFFISLDA